MSGLNSIKPRLTAVLSSKGLFISPNHSGRFFNLIFLPIQAKAKQSNYAPGIAALGSSTVEHEFKPNA
jgi:hypothetical protein